MKMLAEDIKNANFKTSYLLCGEELYLRDQYKNRLLGALIEPDDTMNLARFEGKGADPIQIKDTADTLPFLSAHRVVLIEDSGFFKKGGDALADYIPKIPETTCLIFVENEVDKRSRLYKAVNKYGRAVDFQTQDDKTLTRWVAGRLKKENHKITADTLALFLKYTGSDMVKISMELEKLLSYTLGKEVITEGDIEDICSPAADEKIFAMIDCIAAKQQRRALELYYALLSAKEPPMRILYLISRQFDQLLHVKALVMQGFDKNAVAERLKLRPYFTGRYISQASNFTMQALRAAVESCASTEEDVKSGRLDGTLGVELLIVTLSR